MAPRLAAGMVIAAAWLLAGCADTANTPELGAPTPQAQAMQHMLADINQIRGYVYGSSNRSEATAAAADLQSWAARLEPLFPPAKASQAYVDMSLERARLAPAAMTAAAQTLAAAVRSGSLVSVAGALEASERDGCGACHLTGPGAPPR